MIPIASSIPIAYLAYNERSSLLRVKVDGPNKLSNPIALTTLTA